MNPVVSLGESFRTITQLHKSNDAILARVELTEASLEESHEYVLHPLLMNSIFLGVSPFLKEDINGTDGFLPFGIKAGTIC